MERSTAESGIAYSLSEGRRVGKAVDTRQPGRVLGHPAISDR